MSMKRTCDFCGGECVILVKGFSDSGVGNIPISKPISKITFDYGDCERESDLCAECTERLSIPIIKTSGSEIELSANFVIGKIAEWFGEPCNWSFEGIGSVDEYMYEKHGDWCKKNCGNNDAENCWRKLFEGVANDAE